MNRSQSHAKNTRYWLMKTEPDVFSIDDLRRKKKAPWDGVRNYQARNNMMSMNVGDLVLFYHSSCQPPGVAGVARVCRAAYPDSTAWDRHSEYFDPKASPENPVWKMVEVEFVQKFSHFIPLDDIRTYAETRDMVVIRRGMRLSVQPVTEKEFSFLCRMGSS